MAITNAQQYQQLVNKPANGKRPGYRGPGGYQGGRGGPTGPGGQSPGPGGQRGGSNTGPGGNNNNNTGGNGGNNYQDRIQRIAEQKKREKKAADERAARNRENKRIATEIEKKKLAKIKAEKIKKDREEKEAKEKEKKVKELSKKGFSLTDKFGNLFSSLKEKNKKFQNKKNVDLANKRAFQKYRDIEQYVDMMDDYGLSAEEIAKGLGVGAVDKGLKASLLGKDSIYKDGLANKFEVASNMAGLDINKFQDLAQGKEFLGSNIGTGIESFRPNLYDVNSKIPSYQGALLNPLFNKIRPDTQVTVLNTLRKARDYRDLAGTGNVSREDLDNLRNRGKTQEQINIMDGNNRDGGDNYVPPIVPKKSDDDDTTSTEDQDALNYRIMGGGFDFSNLADGGRAGLMDGGIMRLGLKDGELAYDASDASIFGSSAISVTPETMMDGFGNQVQKEMGNTFNPPLIEDVIQEKSVIEDTNKLPPTLTSNNPYAGDIRAFNPGVADGNFESLRERDFSDPTIRNQADIADPITGKTVPKDLISGFQSFIQKSGAMNRPMTGDVVSYRLPDGTVRQGNSTMRGLMDQYLESIGQSPTTGVPASRVNLNQDTSPLMRAAAADGGMMSPVGGIMDLESGRQMYVFGKLVKKVTRAVKKVAKSPFGKAALLYGLGAMGGSFGAGKGFFSKGMFNPSNMMRGLIGAKGAAGTPGIGSMKGLLGKLGITKGFGGLKPTLGGGITLGLGVPFALDLLGVGKEEDNDEAYRQYVKDMSLNMDAKKRPFDFLNRRIAGGGFKFAADGGIMRNGYAEGSEEPVAKKTMPLLDMDGMEKDYREDGGFVPIGRMERADDVPARLSKNEFVFTADAVRNAGDGDIDKGAEVMYNMMKNLESGGEVSEESQGLDGAREMFQTSKRLEEVL